MHVYRIYTERTKALPAQTDAVAERFESFTTIEAQGYWKGVPEPSVVFEIVSDWPIDLTIQSAAETIKRLGQQQAVLVTRHEVESKLI